MLVKGAPGGISNSTDLKGGHRCYHIMTWMRFNITGPLCGESFGHRLISHTKQGSKLRGAEGQNAPKLSPNAPRLLNLGAKFCYPIQPDICFEAWEIAPVRSLLLHDFESRSKKSLLGIKVNSSPCKGSVMTRFGSFWLLAWTSCWTKSWMDGITGRVSKIHDRCEI